MNVLAYSSSVNSKDSGASCFLLYPLKAILSNNRPSEGASQTGHTFYPKELWMNYSSNSF